MTHPLDHLVVAEELAAGRPVGPALRRVPGAAAAARAAEAGQLRSALLSLGLDGATASLAGHHPTALPGALRRAQCQPSWLDRNAPLLQTVALLLLVGGFVQLSRLTLELFVRPTLMEMYAGFGATGYPGTGVLEIVGGALALVAIAGASCAALYDPTRPERRIGGGPSLREVQVAAALAEACVPGGQWAAVVKHPLLQQAALCTVGELESVARAVAHRAHTRLDSLNQLLRTAGLVGLALVSASSCMTLYRTIAGLGALA